MGTKTKKATTKYSPTIRALERARDLLRRNHWTRGYMALDDEGYEVAPSAREAGQFCAVGALRRVTKRDGLLEKGKNSRVYRSAVEALAKNVPDGYFDETAQNDPEARVIGFNDYEGMKRRNVLNLFNRTIRRLQKAA